jgi:hypothetical protein
MRAHGNDDAALAYRRNESGVAVKSRKKSTRRHCCRFVASRVSEGLPIGCTLPNELQAKETQ